MPGLTNYLRIRLATEWALGANSANLTPGTDVNLFTTAPTGDGDGTGGPLDGIEWAAPRKTVVAIGDPNWRIELGSFGGVDIFNFDPITWTPTDTAVLTSNTKLVAFGVWNLNNDLLAWDYLTRPVTVTPSSTAEFPAGDLRIRQHKEIE